MSEHLCAKCQHRPGTEIWVGEGGTLAYVHGMYSRWCRRCVIEAQLEHAKTIAATIPALIRQLIDEVGR